MKLNHPPGEFHLQHAQDMLSHRRISEQFVKETLTNPDYKTQGKFGSSIYLKKFKKNYLKVVLIEGEEKLKRIKQSDLNITDLSSSKTSLTFS